MSSNSSFTVNLPLMAMAVLLASSPAVAADKQLAQYKKGNVSLELIERDSGGSDALALRVAGLEKAKVNVFNVDKPDRVVVDFVTKDASEIQKKVEVSGNPVLKSIRLGSHPDRLRIVLDLATAKIPEYTWNEDGGVVTLLLRKGAGNATQVREQTQARKTEEAKASAEHKVAKEVAHKDLAEKPAAQSKESGLARDNEPDAAGDNKYSKLEGVLFPGKDGARPAADKKAEAAEARPEKGVPSQVARELEAPGATDQSPDKVVSKVPVKTGKDDKVSLTGDNAPSPAGKEALAPAPQLNVVKVTRLVPKKSAPPAADLAVKPDAAPDKNADRQAEAAHDNAVLNRIDATGATAREEKATPDVDQVDSDVAKARAYIEGLDDVSTNRNAPAPEAAKVDAKKPERQAAIGEANTGIAHAAEAPAALLTEKSNVAALPEAPKEMSSLMQIRFEKEPTEKANLIKLGLNQKPQFLLLKKNARTYRLIVPGFQIGSKQLALPQYPPKDFKGLTVAMAEQKEHGIEVLIGVDSGSRITAYAHDNEIWIKPILK